MNFNDPSIRDQMERDGWDCSNKATWSKRVRNLKAFVWYDGLVYIVDIAADKKVKQFKKDSIKSAIDASDAILKGEKVSWIEMVENDNSTHPGHCSLVWTRVEHSGKIPQKRFIYDAAMCGFHVMDNIGLEADERGKVSHWAYICPPPFEESTQNMGDMTKKVGDD